ncbi:MAG: hypothetical protein K6357_05885 [Elusimicrobiota bacterium]
MKLLKIFLAVLITTNLNLVSQDFKGITSKEIKNVDVPMPNKGFVTDVVNAAGQVIEEAGNIIKDYAIVNPVRDLTIMVFINAKNDLESAGLYNVNDMERIGSNDKLNIIVELGRMNGQSGDTQDDGNWIGVRRLLIKKDNDTKKITSPILYSKTGANVYDMGDYKKVIDFVKWTKKKFPAKRYMLILWDHGTGWLDPKKKEEAANKGISFDDETGNYIATEEIGKIVKEVGGVDILAFDACLMQMAEVLTEVKDNTKVVIGSEEVVPGYGYPYGLFLDVISKNPNMSNEDIAKVVIEAFKVFYAYVKQPAMLSAVRSNKISRLNNLMFEFAKAAMAGDEIEALKKARQEIIRFDILGEDTDPDKNISFFGDIYQFADIVSRNISKTDDKSIELKAKAEALKNFIVRELVISRASYGNERTGKSLDMAYGVSAYFPPVLTQITSDKIDGILRQPYRNFKFAKESGWGDFVKFLYEKAK